MESTGFFCQSLSCVDPAISFYFKGNTQQRVCPKCASEVTAKKYPISSVNLVLLPADDSLYVQRVNEVARARQYLETIFGKAQEEFDIAEKALLTQKGKLIEVISKSYEAEMRKNKQHFHQVQVYIDEHRRHLDNYLRSKEVEMSPLQLKMTTNNPEIPSILRIRVFANELEGAELIHRSVFRGELPLNNHLDFFLSEIRRSIAGDQLLSQAREREFSDDFIELQRALAFCRESVQLKPSNVAEDLKTWLEDRIQTEVSRRKLALTEKFNSDAASIIKISTQFEEELNTDAGNIEQVLLRFEQFLSPISISKQCAHLYTQIARNCQKSIESVNIRLNWYQRSAEILTNYYRGDEDTVRILVKIGKLSLDGGQPDEAEKYLQAAMQETEAESLQYFKIQFELGNVYYFQGLVESSQTILESSLRTVQRLWPDSKIHAKIQLQMGLIYVKSQRYEEGEQLYLSSLALLEKLNNVENLLASARLLIGRYYKSQKKNEHSETYLRACTEMSDISISTQKEACLKLAEVLLALQRYEESEKYFFAYLEWQTGCNKLKLAKAHFGLGSINNNLEKFEEAEQNFRICLEIYQAEDQNNSKMPEVFVELGFACWAVQKHEEAVLNFNACRKWCALELPPNPDVALHLVRLREAFLSINHTEEAEEVFQLAVAMYSGDIPTTERTATAFFNIGEYYYLPSRLFEKAAECFLRCLEIIDDSFPESELKLDTHTKLRDCYRDLGEFEEAKKWFISSLQLLSSTCPDSLQLGTAKCEFGDYLDSQDDRAAALEQYKSGIAILQQASSGEERTVLACINAGEICQDFNELDEVERYLELGYQITSEHSLSSSIAVDIRSNLSQLRFAQGRFEEAEALTLEALELAEINSMELDYQARQKQRLGAIYESMGRKEDAINLYLSALESPESIEIIYPEMKKEIDDALSRLLEEK